MLMMQMHCLPSSAAKLYGNEKRVFLDEMLKSL
jgi:hypothetical protein